MNDEKGLEEELKEVRGKEGREGVCRGGGMVESFVEEGEGVRDDDVMVLLKVIFEREEREEVLKKVVEGEKGERG